MIISKTPFRISFFGGGTDYPQWYEDNGGAVLVTSIDKYCYVMLHDGKSWKAFDLPTKSGLGTSSAYTVGLLRVCTELDKQTIAKLATTWEQDKMGGNIGSQDQYVCAVGGFHLLRFSAHGIKDISLDPKLVSTLQDYLLLFDTHQYRHAGNVVAHQLEDMKKHKKIYLRMGEMPDVGLKALMEGNLMEFGSLLDESWQLKRKLSGYVSTSKIDSIYELAIKSGAIGGKLLGAGGGGFIIFFAEPSKHDKIKSALSELTYVPFKFEGKGTEVIYHD